MSTTIKNHSHSPSKRNMNHEEAYLAKAGVIKTNDDSSKSNAGPSKSMAKEISLEEKKASRRKKVEEKKALKKEKAEEQLAKFVENHKQISIYPFLLTMLLLNGIQNWISKTV